MERAQKLEWGSQGKHSTWLLYGGLNTQRRARCLTSGSVLSAFTRMVEVLGCSKRVEHDRKMGHENKQYRSRLRAEAKRVHSFMVLLTNKQNISWLTKALNHFLLMAGVPTFVLVEVK